MNLFLNFLSVVKINELFKFKCLFAAVVVFIIWLFSYLHACVYFVSVINQLRNQKKTYYPRIKYISQGVVPDDKELSTGLED